MAADIPDICGQLSHDVQRDQHSQGWSRYWRLLLARMESKDAGNNGTQHQ